MAAAMATVTVITQTNVSVNEKTALSRGPFFYAFALSAVEDGRHRRSGIPAGMSFRSAWTRRPSRLLQIIRFPAGQRIHRRQRRLGLRRQNDDFRICRTEIVQRRLCDCAGRRGVSRSQAGLREIRPVFGRAAAVLVGGYRPVGRNDRFTLGRCRFEGGGECDDRSAARHHAQQFAREVCHRFSAGTAGRFRRRERRSRGLPRE